MVGKLARLATNQHGSGGAFKREKGQREDTGGGGGGREQDRERERGNNYMYMYMYTHNSYQ